MNQYMAYTKGYNEERNTITAWASTDSKDRSNEVIDPEGWELENFLKNPVLLPFHQYTVPPIGKVINIQKVDRGLMFEAQFADTESGREMAELYKSGVMSAFSVGFIPKKWEMYKPDGTTTNDYWESERTVYRQTELLEISAVSVPDNQDALVLACNEGRIKSKTLTKHVDEICSKGPKSPIKIEVVADETETKTIDDGDNQSGQTDKPGETPVRADTEVVSIDMIKSIVRETIEELKEHDAKQKTEPVMVMTTDKEIKSVSKKELKSILESMNLSNEIPLSEKRLNELRKRGIVQV